MKLTKEERIARHKSFLQANWEIIAAFSWGNYLEKGRGAVLVPEEDFVHQPIPVLKGLRFHYLPMEGHEASPFKGILSDRELAWVKTYDPDEKVILCIIREGGGVSSYLIGGRSKPSEAWARQKAGEN
ncbi:MAG: hypothetical protein K8T26_01500 [Lentisphaerae bacterium]|nr:hypothetical protein [Lentisphaerota bacterium]